MVEMGKIGFVWFFGVVESVADPLQVGRVKVRVYHFYTPNDTTLPTDDLPWAHVVMPTTSASYQGKGWSPTFVRVDSTVFGFFVDGAEAQMPIVLGTFPGIPQPNPDFVDVDNITDDNHDVSKLARGVNKLAATKAALADEELEPTSEFTYRAQYPHNKVFESERGHVIEMDDTPGAERLHMYHNGGSYVEMSPGLRVDKVNGTHIETASVARYIKSQGDTIIIADGATTVYSTGSINLATEGQINMSAKLINMNATLGININAGALLSVNAIGGILITSSGAMRLSGLLGLYLNSI